jgi:SNF2-related domain
MTFYVDAQRNLIVYPGQPGILTQYIPDLKPLNGSFFAVPRTLANLQVLAWYNFPTPAPMASYDFPIEPGKTPLPHQKIYANFQALHPRCFNLGDPGTMKTLSTLWAMDFIMQQYENSRKPCTYCNNRDPCENCMNTGLDNPTDRFRALIVAPLTLLDTVWSAAIFRNFLSRRTYAVLTGDGDRRIKQLDRDVDIYIINPDGLKVGAHIRRKVDPRTPHQKRIELDGFCKALAARDDIQMVIIDEASGFKDPTTARHACATLIFGKKRWLWQLTGSPTPNRPTDAYGMAKLSNGAYGKSFKRFQIETMIKVSEFKWVPQRDGYDKAKQLLSPAVRFALSDVWDGPPMTTQRRRVELTAEQKEHMKKLKNELQMIVKGGHAITAMNESAARQKLIQLSLGAVYDGEHFAHLVDAAPRYRELEEIIESTQRKVVVFVPITSVVHLVVKYLRSTWKKQGLPWTCDFINGEVDAKKDRPKVIRAFVEQPDFKAVIVDPGVTAHGINEFVAADTCVWFGATDKAELWIQGNARLRRPGQRYPTNCFQIVSNKLEEEIFDRLESNTSMQGLMLAAIRRGDF